MINHYLGHEQPAQKIEGCRTVTSVGRTDGSEGKKYNEGNSKQASESWAFSEPSG